VRIGDKMNNTLVQEKKPHASGKVRQAFGNLLQVLFEGTIRQGEVAYVKVADLQLKAEVIEIAGDIAKLQVFEDMRGVAFGTEVAFTGDLLEAELGPGLLSTVFDGLQNPLTALADKAGLFLPRGIYLPSCDRMKKWEFEKTVRVGDKVTRGDTLGFTREGRFKHFIKVPFTEYGEYEITFIAEKAAYTVDAPIAKAKDVHGNNYTWTMLQKWPIKNALQEGIKVNPTEMMVTGSRIIDTQFPLVRGGTFCTPGPFGAGKTVLQHHLAKYSSVDIVIVTACGERAGEVVEMLREFPHLIDPHTGESLMERTVIICNTSSMPVAARESSVYLGITIAEYYRQMGLNVLMLADSTSRWAQAMREMSGRLEEIPGEEAFPAYLASRIAELYERSGVLELKDGTSGSITVGGAVSPAGGNFEEPVTQATLAVVGAFLGLSRERSDARRYPALDPLMSWSKYVKSVNKELSKTVDNWGEMVKRAHFFLKEGDEIHKRMEVVGEEGTAIQDLIIHLKAELYDFSYLQQNAFDQVDAYCPLQRQITLFLLVQEIFVGKFSFSSHIEAREYFLELQNRIKNMNALKLDSPHYETEYTAIKKTIEQAVEKV
jgi:V/A-type H+/Na+-transporting ATPase subunit A